MILKDDGIKDGCISDFEVIAILGQGAFGKVYLVKKKQTNEVYAMK